MLTLIAPLFNLIVLIVVLTVVLKEPLRAFVKQRHHQIGDAVEKTRQMLRDAHEQYDEFSAKLKAIDVEVAAIHKQAKQDAQGAHERILQEAQKLRNSIVSDARVNAENIFGDLKAQLRGEVAARVLDRVEILFRDRLTSDDRIKIRNDFSVQVGGPQ